MNSVDKKVKDVLEEDLRKFELLKESLIVHQYNLKKEFDLKGELMDDVKDYRCRGYPIPTIILEEAREREQKLMDGANELLTLLNNIIKEQKAREHV